MSSCGTIGIENIYVCLPVGGRCEYMVLQNRNFGKSLKPRAESDSHVLYTCRDVDRQVPVDSPLILRLYYNWYSHEDIVFLPRDLVAGSHPVRDLFPNDVDTSSYTMSMSCDNYTIEVHYKPEDNV